MWRSWPICSRRHIVISPGPGTPERDSGISNDVIRVLGQHTPSWACVWANSASATSLAARWCRAPRLMHGKVSPVQHDGEGLFAGLRNPFTATRYHSLIVQEPLPDVLDATAHTAEGELMGLRHRTLPIYGVQFHPESILTEHGKALLANFLRVRARRRHEWGVDRRGARRRP